MAVTCYTEDVLNAVLNTTPGGLQGELWTDKYAGGAAVMDNPLHYQKIWDQDITHWNVFGKSHQLRRLVIRWIVNPHYFFFLITMVAIVPNIATLASPIMM